MVSSFLLVSLNIDAILGEITLHQRRKKLDETTTGEGLGDAYAATFSRMKAQPRNRSKLGMEALMWVAYAERPLHVNELCHALGVEEGSMDLNIRNIPAIETLLACTLGLVTVEKSSSTFRLVHYTLQEYLSHNPSLFLTPHSAITEVCLTYLNFQHIRSFSPALRSVPPTAPFVEYAACHWGTHARRGITERVKTLALKLLDGFDKHIASKILLMHGVSPWDWPFDPEDTPRGFTGLHIAAYHGCVEIAVALLETNKWDVQATDFNGNTAISWAARRGHEGVVRALLELSDVNLHKADKRHRTPLLLAAESGHEGVVKILLERSDTNPNTMDDWSRTPLLSAAENGHEGVVRVLLQRDDVNPNTAAKWSRTPLLLASENGHERVVEILLGRNDVNPNTADVWGRTPLFWATRNKHGGVVRMLLERNDVNPDITSTDYRQGLLRRHVPSLSQPKNPIPAGYGATVYPRGSFQDLPDSDTQNPRRSFESLTTIFSVVSTEQTPIPAPELPKLDNLDRYQSHVRPVSSSGRSFRSFAGVFGGGISTEQDPNPAPKLPNPDNLDRYQSHVRPVSSSGRSFRSFAGVFDGGSSTKHKL